MDGLIQDWNDLEKEYAVLENLHKDYCKKVADVKSVQKKCLGDIAHQRYVMKQIQDGLKRVDKKKVDAEAYAALQSKMEKRKSQFRELEDVLPHENGLYLKIVLGSVNVSLLSKNDKFTYKEDYERFKLYVTIVNLFTSLITWLVINSRVTDAMFQFLLVWYYCTLTIREHILKVNGSRSFYTFNQQTLFRRLVESKIKGWWIAHHFISTACAAIFLIWPDSFTYHEFRTQFYIFSFYLTMVQMMQYYYQSGSLYRLRSLGQKRSMDLTVEGFQAWMWKGLSFLLPFLVFGYLFQLYNAYVLFTLAFHPECHEWQVIILSGMFFVLFAGNSRTVSQLIRQKFTEKFKHRFTLKHKYRFFTDKSDKSDKTEKMDKTENNSHNHSQ